MRESLFDQCKELDTPTVLRWLGSHPHKRGKNVWSCPTPGCDSKGDNLRVDIGRYGMGARCFAGCGSMSNVDLVMAAYDVDHLEAARMLGSEFDLIDAEPPTKAELARWRNEKATREAAARRHKQRAQLGGLSPAQHKRWAPYAGEAMRSIYDGLGLGNMAAAYLRSRGLDPEMCARLGVQSAEFRDDWVARFDRVANEELAAPALVAAGLAKMDRTGHITYSYQRVPALVFGYFTGSSTQLHQLESLRFRPIGQSSGGPKHLSLRGSVNQPTMPYLHDAAEAARRMGLALTVCEGELNALSVMQAGGLAVSAQGSTSWKDSWGRLLSGLDVLVLADGDDAGSAFARTVTSSMPDPSRATVVACGTGKDANDMLIDGDLRGVLLEHRAASLTAWDGART